MITARDVEFHTPPDADRHWAETNMFLFSVPERRVMGTIYTCVRAGLGVCVSEVILFNRLSRDRWDALYFDSQQHLGAPARLEDYSLDNGLSVRAVGPPRDYRIDYEGIDGAEIHLDVAGLMDPYDIHDKDQAPTAQAERSAQIEKSSFGAAYSGHFDMSTRVRGTLTLYGTTIPVDCVASMDHSWGPRTERGMRAMVWSDGHFGEEYLWHALWEKRLLAPAADEFRLAHGYVVDHGSVLGLQSGTMVVRRRADSLPVSLEIELVDRKDQLHAMSGRALSAHDWIPHTSLHVGYVFYELKADGVAGYGLIQEAMPIEMMARINGAEALR